MPIHRLFQSFFITRYGNNTSCKKRYLVREFVASKKIKNTIPKTKSRNRSSTWKRKHSFYLGWGKDAMQFWRISYVVSCFGVLLVCSFSVQSVLCWLWKFPSRKHHRYLAVVRSFFVGMDNSVYSHPPPTLFHLNHNAYDHVPKWSCLLFLELPIGLFHEPVLLSNILIITEVANQMETWQFCASCSTERHFSENGIFQESLNWNKVCVVTTSSLTVFILNFWRALQCSGCFLSMRTATNKVFFFHFSSLLFVVYKLKSSTKRQIPSCIVPTFWREKKNPDNRIFHRFPPALFYTTH